MQLAIVIMAAGKGTRLKSRRPKVLHQIGGRALVEHVIAAAAQVVEPKDIYVVIGHEAEAVRAALRHTGVRFVVQAEQRGTGHAIQTVKPEQLSSPEINAGIYAFRAEPLFKHIGELSTDNAHGEFYLTDMAALLVKARERVVALETTDVHEVLGANTIAEMMELDAEMRMRKAQALMAEGVTIFRPETSVIDSTVTVGADTIVEPFVQLLGRTNIGSGCRIRSYSVIEDSTIGDDVLVRNGSVISTAQVAKGALIGPYAHLRPESEIGEGAHVGNFVETKKSRLGAGAKANHLSYIGDAEIGAGTNIGAGTITCNYDGKNKHRTTIGANVFVGSDSTLVAPLAIADGSYIAAGSTITEDVPADALALGRARQTTKPDWAKKMRSRK